VDDLVVERQDRLEGGHGLRGQLVLPARDEAHSGSGDL
jgi:hypothetical protein